MHSRSVSIRKQKIKNSVLKSFGFHPTITAIFRLLNGISPVNKLALLLCTSLLSACSYNSAPVVGSHDKTQLEYEQDLAECREKTQEVDKAEAVRTSATNMAAIGTAAGAVGGLFSDSVGMGESMVWGLALGAGTGAAVGSVKATQTQSLVLRRCMELKGYEILDAEVDDLASVELEAEVESKRATAASFKLAPCYRVAVFVAVLVDYVFTRCSNCSTKKSTSTRSRLGINFRCG